MTDDVAATRARFLREFPAAVEDDRAAVLVGAGLSVDAGFVNWRQLLKDIAEELDLDIEQEWDLPGVAQYYLDGNNQDRSRLNQMLLDEFRPANTRTSPSHRLLAQLPIRDVWTTNYDECLEEAYRSAGRVTDVKRHNVPSSWTSDRPEKSVTIYKIHGDTTDVGNVILSRDDYDTYQKKYPHVLPVLQTHMTQKSFLIVGFSLTDPNLDHVLSQLRSFFVRDQRPHWLVLKQEADAISSRRQELRIRSLRRYGVDTVLVEDYSDVPLLLAEVESRLRRRNVLVSGSAGNYGLLPAEEGAAIESLSEAVGRAIIDTGHVLVSGLGLGVGAAVLTGAASAAYTADADVTRRMLLRPFPRSASSDAELTTRWRADLVRAAGIVIFIAGCSGSEGSPEVASGVLEEFELAVVEGGAWPIPVGSSGWAARLLYDRVAADPGQFLPPGYPVEAFETLGDESAGEERTSSAVTELLLWMRDAVARAAP